MKRIVTTITVMAAALLISTLPTRAEEGMGGSMEQQMDQPAQKDECLLVSKNCGDQVDSIQDRIDHLQKEIGRGTDVYTPGELNILRDRLEEDNRTLDEMLNSGGG